MFGSRDDAGPTGRLRPLNAPFPVTVEVDPDGVPTAVVLRGRSRPVAAVRERWRIDEGWWWEHPVSRLYWQVVLDSGRLVTVYRDLGDDTWWSQRP